jgi:hypothetical protein
MKPANKLLLRARAAAALADLYHNATPSYPRGLDDGAGERFQAWLDDAAQWEIEYIQDGGAYGTDYRATLAAPCNAGRYKSEAARRYYIAKGLRARAEENADCGALTGWRVLELAAGNERLQRKLRKVYKGAPLARNDARWEHITNYGELYQYGRGGRTLAPADLYSDRGRSKYDPEEHSAAELVELIQILESFNRYVRAWCASVPEQWAELCAEEERERQAEQADKRKRKAKETRERHYWEARGLVTV